MIEPHLLALLKAEARLFHSQIHGITHWATVARNGLHLAQFSGADAEVVLHFAFFHDCQRRNDGYDPKHGPRAAAFLDSIRPEVPLNDEQFHLLKRACAGHTHGTRTECVTLGTCWDADRLDLGRVGITPDARYLFTDEGKRIADERDYAIPSRVRSLVVRLGARWRDLQ